ncbi:MAG: CCA tRNA nucleotidyltransferase [Nitrospirae bacterium]|nr:CCA tRNA nucleotidyltransferase [Nitrospirota bacterium]MBI3377429.1 CCA tRNA nucleotidyltransferase [Nitrospirota bacterium]
MKNIRKIVLGNKINSKVFSLGREAYIVGGYLRDILIGKKSRDLDYVVRGDIRQFAGLVYAALGLTPGKGTTVELKKEQMIRIVLKNGITLDFTELKDSIRDNLSGRDFTMNAIAWSPETGLIDPFNGIKDIAKHRIKAISIDNFKNDPLRLLRAYRFVSELGWKAEPETRKMVRHLRKEIRKSAPERITLEFFKLLNFKNFYNALKTASDDGLLECFLSIPRKRLFENIRTIPSLELCIKKLPLNFKRNIEKPFSQELTLHGLLRLEQVLYSSALNKNRLRLSRIIFERLKMVHELLSKSEKQDIFSQENLFNTFFKAKDSAFDLLILSGNVKLLSQLERFKKIWKRSLLASEEIMEITGLKGGVKLGKLIYGLKKMQFEGKLKTKKEAEKWLKSISP